MDQKEINSFIKKKELLSFRQKQVICFFAILGAGVLFVWIVSNLLTPEQWGWYWKLTIVYFIPPAGKETVIPAGLGLASSIGIGVPLPAFIWGLSILVFDILACLAIITNWWLFELLISVIPAFPFIGIRWKQKPRIYKTKVSLKTWYDGLHKKTKELEAKKYGKILPFALFIFMFIPFQGTGAMSTTIIGTWLGLRRRETILIVAFGSFLSIMFMILISLGILKIWG
ncbi:MAG: hypothetical protein A3K77_06110 [Euryarchaeota archaeon RBG_13_31_8]|nr:MAG: hypothetical protein A3K77_06110 [Euryarchaeota archaeon RBG_13_31_8]